jgi:hypothetical protein
MLSESLRREEWQMSSMREAGKIEIGTGTGTGALDWGDDDRGKWIGWGPGMKRVKSLCLSAVQIERFRAV